MFDPKTDRFPYPLITDKHYLVVKKNDGTIFDENYPYVDYSKKYLRKCKMFRILLRLIAFPITRIRMNLRVERKKNLKKYKDVLDNGFVSICNHVHMWDFLSIMATIKTRHPRFLAWGPNITGENGKMMRLVGGVPIPDTNVHAKIVCYNQITEHIKNGGWFHIYPEGSMWEFYRPIRPFKEGAAYFAVKADRPILPLAYTYRENGWLRKKIFNSPASFTLHIGEPIYPDKKLPFKEAKEKLTIEAHNAVCKLAGIDPEKNLYKPIFNNDERVDYYTSTYGVGYKKSW